MLSALVSSSLQRLSSALRLHSLTKAVYLASLSLLGLIRSFHDIVSLMDVFSIFDYTFFPLFRQALLGVSDGQNQIQAVLLLPILRDKGRNGAVEGEHDLFLGEGP